MGAYEYVDPAQSVEFGPGTAATEAGSAAIRMGGAGLFVSFPAAVRSPLLAIIDLAGREVCHVSLIPLSMKTGANGSAVHGCLWRGPIAPGTYFAVVMESTCAGGAVIARTKCIAGR
jgi:hypothetical protein